MNRDVFFAVIRPTLGPFKLSQVEGFTKILDEGERRGVAMYHQAYILATTWWETDKAMQPIREKGGEKYLRSKKYYPWVGEGLVQVTWKTNHAKFGATKPGQLLTWPIALKALYDGMLKGMFTGKKLDDYIKPGKVDYKNARRIVNGTDRATEIANLALLFEKAIRQAEVLVVQPAAPPPAAPPTPEPVAPVVTEPQPELPATAQPVGFWARLKSLFS